jgi:Phage-related minor tail protein
MADIQSNINVNVDTSGAISAIKNLQREISAVQQELNRGTATQVSAAAKQQQNLINNLNATRMFSAEIKNIKTTTESFTTALEKNKLSLGQYFRYSIAATKSFGGAFQTEMNVVDKVARERVKSLQTQYIKLGRDANGAMKAIAVRPLMLDMDNLATKTAIAAQKQQIFNQLIEQGSTNLLNFGKNTQWAGRQLMVGFTIPLVMAGTAAAKAYMQIEQASVNIRRVYGDLSTSVQETNQMVKSIQNLATEYTKYGIAVADTMAMAAKAAAMGKTGVDLLAQVGQATKLAALGGVDQNTALDTTISLTNAFGISADQLAGKIDFLNAVENQTVLSIEDMTTAIPKAAPVVKQLGGSVEDLTFFLTAMKEGGINASEGANALKSGLSALINPTKTASNFLAGFGVNVKGIVEQDKGNLKKTVVDFATALDKIDPLNRARAIEMMFGKFQFARISTLLKNVTDQGSQATKVAGLASMSAIQLAAISRKELDKISSSPMYKFQKAMADLQLKLAPVGEAFLKAVTPVIGFVSKILDGFNGMSDQFKNFVVVGAAILGGLVPVLLMVTGLVANGAANIIKFFAGVRNFFSKTASSSKVLGEATNYLTEEQIKAEAVAASLDQIHSTLVQTFTAETESVNLLTSAYERAIIAQSGLGMPPVAGARAAKGFATGGVVRGPGTSISDSVPANLSNGEVVLSVETVRKNPALVGALLSGKKVNVPGYVNGGTAGEEQTFKYFKGAAELTHFGNAGPEMTGRQLQAQAESRGEAAVARTKAMLETQAKILGVSTEEVLDVPFKTFTNKVVLFSKEINNALGQTKGKNAGSVDALKVKEEVAYRGQNMHAPMIAQMKDAGATEEEIKHTVAMLDKATKDAFGKFADDARITGEEFDRVMDEVYKKVVGKQKGKAKEAYDSMSEVHTVQSKKENSRRSGYDRTNLDAGSYLDKNEQYILGAEETTGVSNTPVKTGRKMSRSEKNKYESLEKQNPKEAQRLSRLENKDDFHAQLAAAELVEAKDTKANTKKKKDAVDKQVKAIEEDTVAIKESTVAEHKQTQAIEKTSSIGPEGAIEANYSQSRIKSASKPGRVASPFIERLKSSVAAAPSNLANEGRMISNEAKSIFEQLKNIFKIGGDKAVEAVKTGLIDDSQQLVVAGQKMGFDYIEALKGGNGAIAAVVTSGNQKIIAAALEEYNAGGYKIAGAVSLGLDKGIAAEISSGIIAAKGKKIADAIAEGSYMAGSKQKKVPYGQEGPLLPGQTVARMPIGQRLTEMKNSLAEKASNARGAISERYAAGKAKGAAFLDEKVLNKTSGSLAKIGGAATAATFALSMIPGPIGGFMQSLLPFISIASMLPPLFSALGISTLALTGEMVMAALPVVAVLALLAGGIAIAVALNNQANDAKKREIDRINNSVTAHDNANKAMGELGRLAGITPGNDRSAVTKTALSAGIGAKQASDVNILLNSAEFKDSKSAIGGLIGNIKSMSNSAATDFLAQYANKLKGAGFDEKTINSMINAIKIKAGQTDLKLDFASVDINTKKGRAALGKEITDAISGVSAKDVALRNSARKKVADPVVTTINGKDVKLSEVNKTLLPQTQARYAAAQAALKINPFDTAAIQERNITGGKDGKGGLISQYKQLQKENSPEVIQKNLKNLDKNNTGYAKTAAGITSETNTVTDNLNSAIGQFGNKSMSKANFTATMKTIQTELGKSSAKGEVMAQVLKTIGPRAAGAGAKIENLSAKALHGAKSFDKTKEKLDLFAIASANPDIGNKLIEQISKIDVNAAGAAAKIQGLINVAKGQALGSSTGVTNTDLTGTNTSGSGGTDPKQLLTDTKASVAASLLNLSMVKKGYNSDFISAITSADAATQKYYLKTLPNGIKVLNDHGKALLAAFNTKTVTDFLTAQKGIVSGAASELTARKQLAAAGLDAESVKTMAARSDVQAALAAAKATVGAKARAKAIKDVIDSLKAEKDATDSLTSAQDKFQKLYDTGTKYLDSQSNIVNRDFEKSTAGLTATILKANQDIQDLQTGTKSATGLNQYNDGLSKIKFREDEINKKYDERAKALDKVAKINQRIVDQQKGQLSLAQALSSGDIAAAAQAAQDMNAQNASQSATDQKQALDDAKQKEIDSLTANVNGKLMTRKDIEAASAIIQEQILDIQIKQLEPAQTAYDLAARAKDASLKSIADQKAQWDDWKASIDAATTSLADYNKAIAAAGPAALAAANANSSNTTTATGNSPTDAAVAASKAAFQASGMSLNRYINRSTGGMVPSYYAVGGYAKGTDTVPAMLTPGEFVVKKFAVDNFGVDNLRAINSGAPLGNSVSNNVGVSNTNYDGSVYNYSVNVNVRSDANPDQIAQAVMMKINQTNGQRIRGNKFNG